jgi:predicted negative regulator of RcsB-dependent stress response
MSKLDLEEQEQIEQIRVFWSRWGHLILGILIVILGSYLAWVQWQNHQNSQAIKASAMFDELEKVSLGPDLVKMTEVFSDLKTHYPKTIYAQQAGLIIAKYQFEAKQLDEAVVSLTWVSNNASLDEFRNCWASQLQRLLRVCWLTVGVTFCWPKRNTLRPLKPTRRPGKLWRRTQGTVAWSKPSLVL